MKKSFLHSAHVRRPYMVNTKDTYIHPIPAIRRPKWKPSSNAKKFQVVPPPKLLIANNKYMRKMIKQAKNETKRIDTNLYRFDHTT